MRVARFGEMSAEENEVSERGFKLTLADVDCAAPVGLRDRVSVFKHCPGFASLPEASARCGS